MPISDPPTGDAAIPGVYYIDYFPTVASVPPDPDFGSDAYYCASPENLSADDTMGDVGNVSWEWSYSANDVEDNPILTGPDFIHPWRSWFRFRCGTTVIMAGPVTNTSAALGEDSVKVAGKSWEAYFERWQFPFDGRPDHVNDYVFNKAFVGNEDSASGINTPAGLCYECSNRDVALIAHDIMRHVRESVSNRIYLEFANLENPVGIRTNYQFTLGDNTDMNSFLGTLAQIGEGFDYWMGQDRKIRVGSPYRFGSTLAPDVNSFISVDTPGLLSLEYNNDGIQGTHVMGTGAGLATQTTLSQAYGYEPVQEQFSRLDVSYDYGDVRNRTQLQNMTKKSLALAINPIRNINMSIDPAQYTALAGSDFWSDFRRGVAIYIAVDLGFHQIDAPYRLKSWSLADNENTGNLEVTLSLERIYAQVADFGNASL